MLERAVDVLDVDVQIGPVEINPAGELLAHHFEADHQVGDHGLAGRGLLLLADARAGAPGQELGIRRDVTDQFEDLARLERQDLLFGVDLHSATAPAFAPTFACASRAARRRWKSSPAWCEERVNGEAATSRKPLPMAWRLNMSNSAGGTKRSTAWCFLVGCRYWPMVRKSKIGRASCRER